MSHKAHFGNGWRKNFKSCSAFHLSTSITGNEYEVFQGKVVEYRKIDLKQRFLEIAIGIHAPQNSYKPQFLKAISVIDKVSPINFSDKCCGKFSMSLIKFFFCKSNCKTIIRIDAKMFFEIFQERVAHILCREEQNKEITF